jgi:palmitoyltransferase ZDHHC6
VLPESPWTYNNDMLNPDLHPLCNKTGGEGPRQRRGRRIRQPQTYAVPPYHPDYDEGAAAAAAGVSVDDTDSEGTESPADKDDYYDDAPSSGRPLRRRGSEGLEVRPIDREAMLRQYVEQTVQEYGRYERYLPESISDSDDENEDNVPLAQLRHS